MEALTLEIYDVWRCDFTLEIYYRYTYCMSMYDDLMFIFLQRIAKQARETINLEHVSFLELNQRKPISSSRPSQTTKEYTELLPVPPRSHTNAMPWPVIHQNAATATASKRIRSVLIRWRESPPVLCLKPMSSLSNRLIQPRLDRRFLLLPELRDFIREEAGNRIVVQRVGIEIL